MILTGTKAAFSNTLGHTLLAIEDHDIFKKGILNAIGLIHTGGTQACSNIILESA